MVDISCFDGTSDYQACLNGMRENRDVIHRVLLIDNAAV